MALQGKLTQPKTLTVKSISNANTVTATSISHIPSQRLGELVDVDTSAQQDGSIIMWDSYTSSYKVRPDVENPNLAIIGGSF
jgi:hypothetical protein